MRSALLLALPLCIGWSAPAAAQDSRPASAPASSRPTRLRRLVLETRNVYADHEVADNLLYESFNWLHATTDPEVLRRELWFCTGDLVTTDEVEELERNLRAMTLFGEVRARLLPAGPDTADLEVRTRDRFSLAVGAAAGYVGGVLKFGATASEYNLFGTGKEVATLVRIDGSETLEEISWFDPQLLGTWHQLEVAGGKTDEGWYSSVDLTRPFKHLEDPVSWGISASSEDRNVDYFERGASVVQVPKENLGGRSFLAVGFGTREVRSSLAIDLRGSLTNWSPAMGRDRALVRVPGDVSRIELGPLVTLDYAHSYQKVTGLDALDFVEDLRLGFSADARYASVWRDEKLALDEPQRLLDVGARAALEPLPETWITIAARGELRMAETQTRGWGASGAVHAFQCSLPLQTLAASVTLDAAQEHQDLVPQFTLGEDNGLRGYPAREFAGQRRVRLNLEDRVRTGIELWSVHVGLVGFFDAGWVWDAGQSASLGDAITSAGFGLRLGSSHLFGRNVLRLDFAFPLDRVNGQGYSMSVSAALNQVFGFFGNKQELRSEF